MAKVPTIYDVAALAGVSIATVSFSFQRPEKVSTATREAVLAAARELAYVPSAHARGLASGRAGILGLCSYDYLKFSAAERRAGPVQHDDLRHYPIFIDEVQRGVQLESWRQGYALLVRGGTDVPTESIITDLASRVDGLAVFPNTMPMDLLLKLSQRIPVVALSEAPEGKTTLGFVTVDNSAAMGELTNHLIDVHALANLAFVGSGSVDIDRRFAGFQSALGSAALAVPEEPVGGRGKTPHAHQVEAGVSDLIARRLLPEAFVCATDQHAVVVIELLRNAGIRVPQQVAVTGFDGLLISQFIQPSLTTVRQPMQEMGAAAVQLIVESMSGNNSPKTRTFETVLVIGESCGC